MSAQNRNIRIVFNATTNGKGGAVQNAANFLLRAQEDQSVDWSMFVSEEVAEVARDLGADVDRVAVVESPARSKQKRELLPRAFDACLPDIVYTMAGPAYLEIRSPHVMGISNPYLTHPTWEAYLCGRGPISAASEWLKNVYRMWWAKKADAFIFQTETARGGFHRRCPVGVDRTFVVPNAFGLKGVGGMLKSDVGHEIKGKRVVFVPAAGYPHKALQLLPDIVSALRRCGRSEVIFVVTLDASSGIWRGIERRAKSLGVADGILNVGVTAYTDMAMLYRESEVVFVPSLLETFSTSYLEAMGFGKPLVVPDRSFAKEVCGDGAIYYDGTAADAGRAIEAVLSNREDWVARVIEGQGEVLARYAGQDERYFKIREILVGFLREKT